MEDIVALVMIPGMFVLIAWIIFSNIRAYKVAKLQADLRSRLLDRFGSAQDLLAYIQTDDGKRCLESAVFEQGNQLGRVLGSIQAGVLLTLVSIALLLLRSRVEGAAEPFLVFGAVLLALGIGFLISAGTAYALSKSLGALPAASHR